MDQTHCSTASEVSVPPSQHLAQSFSRVAFTVHGGRKNPSCFRRSLDRGLNIPFVIGKSQFADEAASRSFFDCPIPESQQQPVARVAQKLRPGFFLSERLAADIARHRGISPHSRACGEVVKTMPAQAKSRRFQRGDRCQHSRFRSVLSWQGSFDSGVLSLRSGTPSLRMTEEFQLLHFNVTGPLMGCRISAPVRRVSRYSFFNWKYHFAGRSASSISIRCGLCFRPSACFSIVS